MTIASKIEQAKKAIAEKKSELATLAESAANGEDVAAETLETLTKGIEEDQAKVESLEKAEQVLLSKSAPAFIKNKASSDYDFAKSAVVALKAKTEQKNPVQVATELYGEDSGTVAVTKAITDAARTDVAAWAGSLIQTAYGSFMDSLRPVALLPQLAAKGGVSLTFDKNGTIQIPYHLGTPNLSGAWINEGMTIPVKKTAFGTKSVSQNKLGVITVATSEMLKYSTIDLEAFLKDAIVKDTAAVLDAAAFDGSAAVVAGAAGVAPAARPASLINALGANTRAAASADAAGLIAAAKAAVGAMTTANMGRNPVLVTTPQVALAMQFLMNATGQFIFANELSSGRFMGMPVVTSTAAPADSIYIIDVSEVYFGLGQPSFSVSDTAALEMADDPATGPALAPGGTKRTASMFQNDMYAIRMITHVGWSDLRGGSVQGITGLTGL